MAGMLFYQPAGVGDAIDGHARCLRQDVEERVAQLELLASEGCIPR